MSSCLVREHFFDDPLMPRLFMQSWCPEQRARGCILITHGLAEHSECYDHLARALCDQGWWVFAWDLQGHGRSQGARGYIKDFNHYCRDLKSVIKKLKEDETLPTSKMHLIGHSMGGLITLQALASDQPPKVLSATLSNPALGLAMSVSPVKHVASEFLENFWPRLTLNNELKYHLLSRDPEQVKTYSKDPLRHQKISAPLYLGMLRAMDKIKKDILNLSTPVFFQISGQDGIVNPQASLDLYKRIEGPKSIKIYSESYHEIYNDLNKDEAIDDLCNHLGEFDVHKMDN